MTLLLLLLRMMGALEGVVERGLVFAARPESPGELHGKRGVQRMRVRLPAPAPDLASRTCHPGRQNVARHAGQVGRRLLVGVCHSGQHHL